MKPTTLLAVALIVVGLWGRLAPSKPAPAPAPERPNDVLVAAVNPVAAILKGQSQDGGNLAALYAAIADVIARDEGKVIQTTAQVREVNRRAGLLMFQKTGIAGKYAGLSAAIDKVLEDRIGLDDVPIDAANRTAAIDAFKALAWACGGGNG